MYWYFISAHERERELAELEARAMLLGCQVTGKIVESATLISLDRPAYLDIAMEPIARAGTLEELLPLVAPRTNSDRTFKVEVRKYARRSLPDSQDLAANVGARLAGRADLTEPDEAYLLIAAPGSWRLGQVIARSPRDWLKRVHKPFVFSGSLTSRMARALVNLVANPGDRLLDACCGAGTVSLEAASMGMVPVGVDLSLAQVYHTRGNLRACGLRGFVCRGDVRHFAGRFAAVVADFPYGRYSHLASGFYRDALLNLATLAPKAAIVAAQDLTGLLQTSGYQVTGLARVGAGSLVRHIHVCCSRRFWPKAE